jgi:hypothetical protein
LATRTGRHRLLHAALLPAMVACRHRRSSLLAVALRRAVALNLWCRVHSLGRCGGAATVVARIYPHIVRPLVFRGLGSPVRRVLAGVHVMHPGRCVMRGRIVGAWHSRAC